MTDDTRVRAAIPTIEYLKDKGAKIILMSHLGRPKGDGPEPELAPRRAADKLAELTGYEVKFVDDTYGEKAEEAVDALEPGDILVLENVRFDKREKKNDPEIAKTLASYGDIFVLDAFGTAHRAQGSVVGPAAYLPAVAGFLLEKEVDTLTGIFAEPERPFVAIVGGSKVSSKIGVLDHLIDSADTLIIGGGMAYTFFLAKGYTVGTSLQEPDWVERAGEMLKKAEDKGVKILLPVDNVVTDHFGEDAVGEVVDSDKIPADRMGMDIGPKTEVCTPRPSPAPRPCSGTAPWASSRWTSSPTAPRRSPRPSRPTRAAPPSSAAAIRRGREQVRPGRQDVLDLHRRRRPWSSSRARPFPGVEGAERCRVTALRPHRRQLEDEQRRPAAVELAQALVDELPADNGVEVVVCPPTIDLACTSHKIEGSAIKLGAQNVYWEGVRRLSTGETSCSMLKSVDAAHCIIGHSERRDYFHETDADENKKARPSSPPASCRSPAAARASRSARRASTSSS